MKRRTMLIAGIVMTAAGVTPAVQAGPDLRPIQPGAHITPVYADGCTLNFVFRDDAGALYIGSAGHCLDLGEIVRLYEDNSVVGTTVFSYAGSPAPTANPPAYLEDPSDIDDFSLVQIDPSRYADVDPSVRTWGGPTGILDPEMSAQGDLLAFHGNGIVNRQAASRGRYAALMRHDDDTYTMQAVALHGDSGSPIVHARTGAAVGIMGRYDAVTAGETGVWRGNTVGRILELLSGAGFDLELVDGSFSEAAMPDARDCDQGAAPLLWHDYLRSLHDPSGVDPTDADRMALCANVNGDDALFAGGEFHDDDDPGSTGTGFCGSFSILGMHMEINDTYDYDDPGPDGTWGTDDDRTCD